ncbi:MAG: biotin/lipoyl-binding protein, partial [Variovorax sp.]|nr:biotin/lipoyl-binding protein [Variovorax sp.]
MKRSTLITLIVLTLVVVGGAAFMLTRSKAGTEAKSKTAAPKPSLSVTVAQPESSELTMTLAANGSVAAWQEASVGSESNGLRLAEVRVNVGDIVKKGQVLATFSPE